jgi:hypothetical protein
MPAFDVSLNSSSFFFPLLQLLPLEDAQSGSLRISVTMRSASSLLALAAAFGVRSQAISLYEYVHAPNPVANYTTGAYGPGVTLQGWGWHAEFLNLTSGTYMTPNFTQNRYIWTHRVAVILPDIPSGQKFDTAAMWITGELSAPPCWECTNMSCPR